MDDNKLGNLGTGMARKFAKAAQAKSRQAFAHSQETFSLINQWAHRNPWMMAGAGLIVGLVLGTKRRNDGDGSAPDRG